MFVQFVRNKLFFNEFITIFVAIIKYFCTLFLLILIHKIRSEKKVG